MARALAGIVVALGLLAVSPLAASGEPRLALLIGNQSYAPNVGRLVNPTADIAIVGAALEKLGFTVTKLADVGKGQMDTAIHRYVDQVRQAGPGVISFFYYSGHGVVNTDTNVNYLIPVDVTDTDSDEVWYSAIEQRAVIDLLSERAKNAIHFVVFDACRSELSIAGNAGKALGEDKGFVPVPDVRGMLIAYSTAAKRTAADSGCLRKSWLRSCRRRTWRPTPSLRCSPVWSKPCTRSLGFRSVTFRRCTWLGERKSIAPIEIRNRDHCPRLPSVTGPLLGTRVTSLRLSVSSGTMAPRTLIMPSLPIFASRV